ncbi:MAG: 50S ribosomal protein L6 [Deltaproteobacteria bacterium]|nr:50S ribosomal protein L6 [Deltaproteobacteria bacterium]NIS77009.1 50S ribosomal protein L6 [Deltaproteobacteria bacterium]
MSRIGKVPVDIPDDVKVNLEGNTLTVTGKLGSLSRKIPEGVVLNIDNGKIHVTRANQTKRSRAYHGLVRTLVSNMVEGVSRGFEKVLEIHGVGYRAEMRGKDLHLTLGYSHPVQYPIAEGIKITVEERNTVIKVFGYDKEKVGLVAAEIRAFRKPDVYKNKGIRYRGERLIKKAGKAVGK